jgi:DNA phosphorothioation-dependent restriction protein DptG
MNGNLTTTLRKKIFCTNFDQTVEQKLNLAPTQAPQTPKAQKLRSRLFRLPKTDIALNISPLSDSNIVTNAANKLCNLAKSSSSVSRIVRSTSPTKLGYSTNNQNYHKSINNIDAIYFNKESDEVDGEQAALWQNLKSISKFPFTNTITLGRRLKKNVRKLSIFNTFSVHEAKKPNEVQPQIGETKDFLDEDHQISQLPPLPSNFSKSNINVTNKMLKKAKKLKKLEKLNNVNSLNTNTTHLFDIYKTI